MCVCVCVGMDVGEVGTIIDTGNENSATIIEVLDSDSVLLRCLGDINSLSCYVIR